MTTAAGAKRTRSKDLEGIRLRGRSYQVRVFSGNDPSTGEKVYLTGSAMNEAEAIRIRNRFRTDIANNKATRSSGTLGFLITTWLDQHPADPELVSDYRALADSFIVPALGNVRLITLTMPGPSRIEKFYAELRRCRRRCDKKPYIEHRKNCPSGTDPDFTCDKRCKPHVCKPLSGSTLRHIHVVLNGAFKAAVKWDWIGVNPLEAVDKPKAPKPQPNPPSAVNAARIIEKAWATDADWGTFVWLAMVTGPRRGELVALRFSSVELVCLECGAPSAFTDATCRRCTVDLTEKRTAFLVLRTNYSARKKAEKDTKSHQIRRISLDPTTAEVLVTHFRRFEERMTRLHVKAPESAYLFSYAPDHSRPCSPDGLTHRYSKMTAELGLDTHLHELRHYSATELLAAGVDLRTVAGRLGHAGGVTTLRVYSAWVSSADEQAAAVIASRLTGGLPAPRPPKD